LKACPTGAFPEAYVLDARRCISYLTIELKGWIPRELRPQMGNWVYGCDICQEVCPFNRFAEPTREEAFWPERTEPTWDKVAPPLLELLALDETGFQVRFGRGPIKRIGRVRLVRNACVAAGNWGSRQAIPALIRLLSDEEPLLRGHAAWALGQIDSLEALNARVTALATEDHNLVREELA
jgi:epoxyqueuosine reductase